MATFLFKTEPSDYSIDDLERDGGTVWDGIANNAALMHLRTVSPGDEALIYHTGKDKSIMGLAAIQSTSYPDPQEDDEKLAVVDIEFKKRAKSPLSLKEIKSDDRFDEFDLVRQPRLSVMPVPAKLDRLLRKMAGL